MKEIITDELIQYKTGFIHVKNVFLELTRLGKVIDLEVKETEVAPNSENQKETPISTFRM